MQVACEKTVSAMYHVLQRTINCAKGTTEPAHELVLLVGTFFGSPGWEGWAQHCSTLV